MLERQSFKYCYEISLHLLNQHLMKSLKLPHLHCQRKCVWGLLAFISEMEMEIVMEGTHPLQTHIFLLTVFYLASETKQEGSSIIAVFFSQRCWNTSLDKTAWEQAFKYNQNSHNLNYIQTKFLLDSKYRGKIRSSFSEAPTMSPPTHLNRSLKAY